MDILQLQNESGMKENGMERRVENREKRRIDQILSVGCVIDHRRRIKYKILFSVGKSKSIELKTTHKMITIKFT